MLLTVVRSQEERVSQTWKNLKVGKRHSDTLMADKATTDRRPLTMLRSGVVPPNAPVADVENVGGGDTVAAEGSRIGDEWSLTNAVSASPPFPFIQRKAHHS